MANASDAPEFGAATVTDCDREPIHTPGLVQPHGCVAVCSARDWIIGHASTNIGDIFGVSAEQGIGRPISALVGEDAARQLQTLLQHAQMSEGGERFSRVQCSGWANPLDIALHQRDGRIVIEFEQSDASGDAVEPLTLVKNVLARLQRADSLADYCELAARQLRLITGYDRVMVYRFAEDDSGEVLAEAARPGAQPFVGLRYPASDIPRQARALYLKNPIRVIADVDAQAAAIYPPTDLTGAPLDLSYCGLRAVSPIHLQYLRNMGVAASMSTSIIVDGRLWGLFACHHNAPRKLSAAVRSACELFSQLFALQIEARQRAEWFEAERAGRSASDLLISRISTSEPILNQLLLHDEILSQVVPSDGVALLVDGKYETRGAAAPEAVAQELALRLNAATSASVFASHELSKVAPSAKGGGIAGVLAAPISRTPRDYILFFRREIIRTVSWAGDPNKSVNSAEGGQLTPRASFDIWKETVRDQCAPWSAAALAAAEALRVSLLEVILRRADAEERTHRAIQERQDVLISELSHRVKNMMALVSSIVRGAEAASSVDAFVEGVIGRLEALSLAHDQVFSSAASSVNLRALTENELKPFCREDGPKMALDGPPVAIEAALVPVFALVLHELATNAVKYGALSRSSGVVSCSWRRSPSGELTFDWVESGGPEVVAPEGRGFGVALIERLIPHELGGAAELRYEAGGLRATFHIPEAVVSDATELDEDREEGEAAGDAKHLPPLPETFRVLLVEDNAIIALDVDDRLRGLGASDVILASSLSDAMEQLETGAFDVALLDFQLGSETSAPIAEKLVERGTPFAFTTGYGDDSAVRRAFGGRPVAMKPYSTESLEQVLREAFSAESSG